MPQVGNSDNPMKQNLVAAMTMSLGALAIILYSSRDDNSLPRDLSGPPNPPVEKELVWNLDRQSLRDAYRKIGTRGQVSIGVSQVPAGDIMVGPLCGYFRVEEVLERLLAGTGLHLQTTTPRFFTIDKVSPHASVKSSIRNDGDE